MFWGDSGTQRTSRTWQLHKAGPQKKKRMRHLLVTWCHIDLIRPAESRRPAARQWWMWCLCVPLQVSAGSGQSLLHYKSPPVKERVIDGDHKHTLTTESRHTHTRLPPQRDVFVLFSLHRDATDELIHKVNLNLSLRRFYTIYTEKKRNN